jgi:hypothetical protein
MVENRGLCGREREMRVPRMRAVFDGFLAILAPLVPIFHDFHITARLNGVPRLPHSLRPLSSCLVRSETQPTNVEQTE